MSQSSNVQELEHNNAHTFHIHASIHMNLILTVGKDRNWSILTERDGEKGTDGRIERDGWR